MDGLSNSNYVLNEECPGLLIRLDYIEFNHILLESIIL